jgi:nicotinamidase/pyrazinamidase
MERQAYNRVVLEGIDMQIDFCPGGSLAVEHGDEVIQPMNEVAEYVRELGGTVVFSRDYHPEETRHFGSGEGQWPVHCVAGTAGADFHPNLSIKPEDIIISKGMGQEDGYSAYEGTTDDGRTLEQLVTPTNRERVAILIGGLATDYCVKASGIDTLALHTKNGTIDLFLIEDAMRAVNLQPGDGEAAIQLLVEAGAHRVTSQQILAGEVLRMVA